MQPQLNTKTSKYLLISGFLWRKITNGGPQLIKVYLGLQNMRKFENLCLRRLELPVEPSGCFCQPGVSVNVQELEKISLGMPQIPPAETEPRTCAALTD